MKPPICEICNQALEPTEEGGLIYFNRTLKDEAWYDRAENQGFVGHPPNAVWFCEKHYQMARNYEHLSRPEAIEKIRQLSHL